MRHVTVAMTMSIIFDDAIFVMFSHITILLPPPPFTHTYIHTQTHSSITYLSSPWLREHMLTHHREAKTLEREWNGIWCLLSGAKVINSFLSHLFQIFVFSPLSSIFSQPLSLLITEFSILLFAYSFIFIPPFSSTHFYFI